MQVQEAQRFPNKMDAKSPTPRHIIIKISKVKDKERILKPIKEKQIVIYREVPIRLSADFIKETLQGNNSTVDKAENQINDLEHRKQKTTMQNNKNKKESPLPKNKDSVSSLWDNCKRSNICVIGVPEGEEKEQDIEIYLKK